MKITTEVRLTEMMLKGWITETELKKYNTRLEEKGLEIENIITEMFDLKGGKPSQINIKIDLSDYEDNDIFLIKK